ncbi:hypothetical protein N2601_29840 (plasmid) [Rhizobium sp. CB3060]|uniref:hypothetical protein n=1 Tax=Rhizobium sp. CB3060 TaxID=3138255 RepID=UPI0021A282AD|nr:hypothetical protein [Rhizobium tropici]UWU25651.1 hypothetical protein N2601_29840 [Rhizobium tropici]
MNRYSLQPEDKRFIDEFMRNPIGHHSPGLQRVLNVMRGGELEGKYVLVILQPYRRWALGRLPARRGEPISLVEGVEYKCQLQAERDVFARRWKDLTGEDIDHELIREGAVNA